MGTLRVKLCDAVVFEKSGNQGNEWKMQEIRLQGSGSREVPYSVSFIYLIHAGQISHKFIEAHGFSSCSQNVNIIC